MKQDAEENRPAARLFAIDDIHGCSTALRTLIEAIDPRPEDTLVILGDFIDCGPDTEGVVGQLIGLTDRCRLICLLGNHEEMLLNALESRTEYRYWLKLGGQQTLRSYSPYSLDLDVIPADHIRLIRGCRDFFETETHIFVHANYDPERPVNRTSGTKQRWEHIDSKSQQPHDSGKVVVIGHTPQAGGEILDLGFLVCIDNDCFRGE
jgi:serine/threonine protein phosphatase 1